MRFDTPVIFVRETGDVYNYNTGDYTAGKEETKLVYADVTDAKAETVRLLFGEIPQGMLVVRIKGRHDEPFGILRIGDRDYRVEYKRTLRRLQVFYVVEVV